MNEKKLNHDVVALFTRIGAFAYKIPDPSAPCVTSAAKRPFDGFAVFPNNTSLFFESKLIKNHIQAFALNRIEPHQLEALLHIKHNGGVAAVLLGYWVSRKDYWFMLFDPSLIEHLCNIGIKSISGKHLQLLHNAGKYVSFHKGCGGYALETMQIKDAIIHELMEIW